MVALVVLLAGMAGQADDAPFTFRDVARESGIREITKGMMAHAAAWADVDGDGRPDLFVGTFADRPPENYVAGGAAGPVPNMLLFNRKDGFVRAEQPELAWLGRATGSVFADFDNDGRPDLYVSNNGRLGKDNLLYHNVGSGRFKRVEPTENAPFHLPETSRGVGILDFDGDGLLDLLVLATVKRGETLLFRNRGAMKFERSQAIPGDAHGLGVACGDLTGNGWPDVMIGGCNRLFVNQGGGRFREAKELDLAWGFDAEDRAPSCGIAFGDFDRDGRPDILIGSHFKAPWKDPKPLRLFRNLGSTSEKVRFEEVTRKVGLEPLPMKLPHVEIRDFDNDGWPDLYTGLVTLREGKAYPAVYRNLGGRGAGLPKFQETAFVHRKDFPAAEDLPAGKRSAAFYSALVANRKVMYFAPGPSADYDGDGRLDLYLASWFPKFPSMLLRNETKGGNWLRVRVRGGKGVNLMGIGSVARAYAPGRAGQAAALLASEEIATGYGYASGQPAVAHLGLGKTGTCDLVVTLPHGKGQIVRRGIKVNQVLTISMD